MKSFYLSFDFNENDMQSFERKKLLRIKLTYWFSTFAASMKMVARKRRRWRNSVAVALDARRTHSQPTSLCHVKSFICARWSKHLNDWVDVNSSAVSKRTISMMSSVRMLLCSCQPMPHSLNSLNNCSNRYEPFNQNWSKNWVENAILSDSCLKICCWTNFQ